MVESDNLFALPFCLLEERTNISCLWWGCCCCGVGQSTVRLELLGPRQFSIHSPSQAADTFHHVKTWTVFVATDKTSGVWTWGERTWATKTEVERVFLVLFFNQVVWLFQLGRSVFVWKVSTISIAENFSQSCRIEVISRTLFCLFVLCGCPVYVYFLWGVLSWKMLTSVLSDGYVLKTVGTETSELSGVVQDCTEGSCCAVQH